MDVVVVVDADADADADDAQPNGTSTRARWVFGFQRLDVYRCAIEFLAVAVKLAEQAPRGYGSLSDQLRRATLSVPLNIAEGSGKTARDGARFYTIARGAALECPRHSMFSKPSEQSERKILPIPAHSWNESCRCLQNSAPLEIPSASASASTSTFTTVLDFLVARRVYLATAALLTSTRRSWKRLTSLAGSSTTPSASKA